MQDIDMRASGDGSRQQAAGQNQDRRNERVNKLEGGDMKEVRPWACWWEVSCMKPINSRPWTVSGGSD